MKNSQKGFAPLAIVAVVVGVIILGGATYFGARNYHPESGTSSSVPQNVKTPITESNSADIIVWKTYEYKIHSSVPIYRFDLYVDAEKYFKKIEIRSGSKIVQTIDDSISSSSKCGIVCEPFINATDAVSFDDINFDGYTDLRIVSSLGATGNIAYDIFIFDSQSGLFKYSESFSEIGGYTKDVAQKMINTHDNMGAAGSSYIDRQYSVKEDSLILIREIEQEASFSPPGTATKTTRERINGVMVEVKVETVDF